ncbi:MAG: ATP-binding cassette domain-containing protein [Lachnospiraceae bacterium]|nr:ATP-binding cassette domain-containing protein [Lachnospiraceae bacterium]
MLEVKHLTKRYEQRDVVSDVSLILKERERVSIQGESGCGKTTLLQMLAGLILPDEGEILLEGEKLPEEPYQRQIAMVFQDSLLWEHMTVEENILFGSPRKGKEERKQQACTLSRALDIEELLHRYPSQISGGQARRVAIARAIACEKKILLLDEPFSNLDKEGRVRTLEAVWELTKGKCALLFVTHSRQEAETLCTRHLYMEEGILKG